MCSELGGARSAISLFVFVLRWTTLKIMGFDIAKQSSVVVGKELKVCKHTTNNYTHIPCNSFSIPTTSINIQFNPPNQFTFINLEHTGRSNQNKRISGTICQRVIASRNSTTHVPNWFDKLNIQFNMKWDCL